MSVFLDKKSKAAAIRAYKKAWTLYYTSPVKTRPPDPPDFIDGTEGAKIRRAIAKRYYKPLWALL